MLSQLISESVVLLAGTDLQAQGVLFEPEIPGSTETASFIRLVFPGTGANWTCLTALQIHPIHRFRLCSIVIIRHLPLQRIAPGFQHSSASSQVHLTETLVKKCSEKDGQELFRLT